MTKVFFRPDLKPMKQPKPPKQGLKRSAIKKKQGKIKKHSETSLRSFINLARIVFQKWIVERDKDKGCISCPAKGVKLQGGHYAKAEIYSGLIFDEVNVNGQCETCNCMKDGNADGYYKGIKQKYGLEKTLDLIGRAHAMRQYKWSREELNEIITKYKL